MDISESICKSITEIVQKEIDTQLDNHMTQYIQYISKKYHIPQKMLIADKLNIVNMDFSDTIDVNQCNGITQKGKRCKASSKKQGYCKRHIEQYIPMQKAVSTEDMNMVKHTHPFTTLYQKGCPGCEKKKIPNENILIGL